MPFSRAMFFDWRVSVVVLGLLVAVPLGWYLGSPLFVSRAVGEAPPKMGVAGSASVTPQLIARGSFGSVDSIHRGQGTASVLRLTDGTRVLRFEEFSVTNGPDLFVYLSGNTEPRTSAELHDVHAFEVAALKGNVGDQNYALPADLDLQDFKSVVIYCRRFSVVFSSAPLTLEGLSA